MKVKRSLCLLNTDVFHPLQRSSFSKAEKSATVTPVQVHLECKWKNEATYMVFANAVFFPLTKAAEVVERELHGHCLECTCPCDVIKSLLDFTVRLVDVRKSEVVNALMQTLQQGFI